MQSEEECSLIYGEIGDYFVSGDHKLTLLLKKASRQKFGLLQRYLVRRSIQQLKNLAGERPIALFLNDYDIGQGEFGGAKRIRELLRHTDFHGVKLLLTFTKKHGGLSKIASDTYYLKIPKTAAHVSADRYASKGQAMSINDIVAAVFGPRNKMMQSLIAALSPLCSHVIMEHPYLVGLVLYARAVNPKLYIVLDAHNFESQLKLDLVKKYSPRNSEKILWATERIEMLATTLSNRIACVTDSDSERMAGHYGLPSRPSLLPNGTAIYPDQKPRKFPAGGAYRLVFVGSSHPPNVSGLRDFVASNPWAVRPEFQLDVIGTVCAAVSDIANDRIRLHGVVSEFDKYDLLTGAHIAINPLTMGGGSSLKLAEYLARGLPTVTTALGCRGFSIADHQAAIIAEPGTHFVNALYDLFGNEQLYNRLSEQSLAFANKNLGWSRVGQGLSAILIDIP